MEQIEKIVTKEVGGEHYNTNAVRAMSREQWIADNLERRKQLGDTEEAATKMLGDFFDSINGKPAPAKNK